MTATSAMKVVVLVAVRLPVPRVAILPVVVVIIIIVIISIIIAVPRRNCSSSPPPPVATPPLLGCSLAGAAGRAASSLNVAAKWHAPNAGRRWRVKRC